MATQTPNYGLTLFDPDDKPTWQGNWNNTMMKLDEVIHQASQGGVEIAQTTGNSTTAVMSQNAVTEAINGITVPEIVQGTGDSTTAVMSQRAVTDALKNATSLDVNYYTQTVDHLVLGLMVIKSDQFVILSFITNNWSRQLSTTLSFNFPDLDLTNDLNSDNNIYGRTLIVPTDRGTGPGVPTEVTLSNNTTSGTSVDVDFTSYSSNSKKFIITPLILPRKSLVG